MQERATLTGAPEVMALGYHDYLDKATLFWSFNKHNTQLYMFAQWTVYTINQVSPLDTPISTETGLFLGWILRLASSLAHFNLKWIILLKRKIKSEALDTKSISTTFCHHYTTRLGARGGVVVKALHYKPAGRGFDSRWCQGFSPWHNPAGRTMALGSTQPLTEMSTRCVSCQQEYSWG